ncbi:MAG: hypothetical protein JWL65_4906 [Gammaproteobacteria bacterium]|jgi:hypothetical protein|nr:hypothetical protein [Gammaproteobacteria bacterium]
MATVSIDWVARHRAALYPVLNLSVLLAALVGSVAHDAEFGLVVYVSVLFAICSTPVLLLRSFNDRYALLGIFMALYFLTFGALDLQHLLFGVDVPLARTSFLSSAEVAVLVGGALILGGYLAGVELGRGGAVDRNTARPPAEWSAQTMLVLGLMVWVAGTAAILYFQLFAAPEKTVRSTNNAFANMGPVLTFIVMLGSMMQPLGVLILAYAYAKYRGAFWLILILTVVSIDVGVGFIIDVKRTALMGGALVILTRTLVDNRLPKAWAACSVVFIVLAFPVFQAYRSEITGNRGLDRLQAFQEIGKVLEITLASRDKVEQGAPGGERAQTFLERSSVKDVLETLFAHVDSGDVPLLHGRSLVAIPMAFVPRLLAPEKADVSVGSLYPKLILKSDSEVFISISHLGELYWNFGWLGILLGMPVGGFLMGFTGAKFSLERGKSLTRILVLLITAQSLCIGFEGTIPIAYILWLRSMAAIGLLHVMFARRGDAPALPSAPVNEDTPPVALALPRFPNLMR